jgi:hypothetical protein
VRRPVALPTSLRAWLQPRTYPSPSIPFSASLCINLNAGCVAVEADEEIARLWHREMVTGGSSYTEPSTWKPMHPEAASLLEERLETAVQDGTVRRAGQFCVALLDEWLAVCAERRSARAAHM